MGTSVSSDSEAGSGSDGSTESEESEESSEDSHESESESSSDNEPSDGPEVKPLGFVGLNDLVDRFQGLGMQDDRPITSTGNKRIREGGQERLLGKSMPGFITKDKDENDDDELDSCERAEKKPRLDR